MAQPLTDEADKIKKIRANFWAADAALNKAKLTYDVALEKWKRLDKEYDQAMAAVIKVYKGN